MAKYGILIGILFFITSTYADIYKWTDSSGTVHFSDEPHPGAQQITLPEVQTPPPSKAPPVPVTENITEKKVILEYKSIAVSQPRNEATIRNNQGFVPVIVELDPELMKGDLLQLVFDGEPMGTPQNSRVFALDNVLRGSHTIAVQVLDKEGNTLITSDAITIYMQRPRVGMVPGTRPKGNAP